MIFYTGEKSPCPCIADGVMLATQASPGQGTLQVAAEKAPDGLLAVVVVRDRKSGASVRYTVADEWMARIADSEQDPRSRRPLPRGHGGARLVPGRSCPVTPCPAPPETRQRGLCPESHTLRITRLTGISQLATLAGLVRCSA